MPFQRVLAVYETSLTKREKHLIFFTIYYLEWIELLSVDREALHSLHQAYRRDIKAKFSIRQPLRPELYEGALEYDVERIKNMLKSSNKPGNSSICLMLLKAVEESFRYGNMPPRFGEKCEEQNTGTLIPKKSFLYPPRPPPGFDEKSTAKVIVNPEEKDGIVGGSEVTATDSWPEIPLSHLQSQTPNGQPDIKVILPMKTYYMKYPIYFWDQERKPTTLEMLGDTNGSRESAEAMVEAMVEAKLKDTNYQIKKLQQVSEKNK